MARFLCLRDAPTVQRVEASFINPLQPGSVPAAVVYIPEGEHVITPYVNGKPKQVKVKLDAQSGPSIAAKFQADLEKRQSKNVRPWVDFDHEGRVSAGNPVSFTYQEGVGLVVAMDWSNAGREAIEGKDYSYVSPTFLLGDDGKPAGLDDQGPILALVNEPAFREIPRIAARHAAQPQHTNEMSKLIFAALGVDPEAENAEQTAVSQIEAMKSDYKSKMDELEAKIAAMQKERDELKEKMSRAEAAAAEETAKRHEAIIEAAVAAGKVAPEDEDTKGELVSLLQANESLAVKMIEKLPGESPMTPVISAGAGPLHKNGDRVEAALAKAKASNPNASFVSQWEKAREIDPEAFAS